MALWLRSLTSLTSLTSGLAYEGVSLSVVKTGDRGQQGGGTHRRIGGVGEVEGVRRGGDGKVEQGSDSSQGEGDPILPDLWRRDQGVFSGGCFQSCRSM